MSDLTIRSREAAQRDIAVAALEKLRTPTALELVHEVAETALAKIAEIEKPAPQLLHPRKDGRWVWMANSLEGRWVWMTNSLGGRWVWMADAPEEPE
jgi:hypothetical protein